MDSYLKKLIVARIAAGPNAARIGNMQTDFPNLREIRLNRFRADVTGKLAPPQDNAQFVQS